MEDWLSFEKEKLKENIDSLTELLTSFVGSEKGEEVVPDSKEFIAESKARNDPKIHMSIGEIVSADGLKFESHFVVTEDGYVLNIHRIYQPDLDLAKKPVVFFQHGLMSSSEVFLLNGNKSSGQ